MKVHLSRSWHISPNFNPLSVAYSKPSQHRGFQFSSPLQGKLHQNCHCPASLQARTSMDQLYYRHHQQSRNLCYLTLMRFTVAKYLLSFLSKSQRYHPSVKYCSSEFSSFLVKIKNPIQGINKRQFTYQDLNLFIRGSLFEGDFINLQLPCLLGAVAAVAGVMALVVLLVLVCESGVGLGGGVLSVQEVLHALNVLLKCLYYQV